MCRGRDVQRRVRGRHAGVLVDPDVHARRLADIRGAALASGVDLVLNARIDTFIRYPERSLDESMQDTIRRARGAYLDAGADYVYPIRVSQPELVAELVAALDAPVNANIDPTVGVDALASAGAARISVGPAALAAACATCGAAPSCSSAATSAVSSRSDRGALAVMPRLEILQLPVGLDHEIFERRRRSTAHHARSQREARQ
ncbi:MAG: hypothetical protein QOG65_1170 [Actinomycetota bacterium]|nr:hypothetical protein [Actinomycetota bacterium]